ncbi:MAG: hypothetical protein U0269_22460 [Polyangiales bacterium]
MSSSASNKLADEVTGAVAIAATVSLSPLLAWRYRRWGADERECVEALPGDALVANPKLESTRAIDIAAPREIVWRWIVQMGHGRAGLYSYEALENIIGCDIHNADEIRDEWQTLAVGDRMGLGPQGYPSFVVRELVENSHLMMLAGGDREPMKNGWTFVLRERENGCRLIVRSRYDFPATLGQRVLWRALTEPMHFVMERRMLQGIRERAEREARATRR